MYERIVINEHHISMLKVLVENRQGPIIFCPTHRSYVDFLLLTTILYFHGIESPFICSGEDFLNMNFISKMLREGGAFFMRRSFKGDPLYKAIFLNYVTLIG